MLWSVITFSGHFMSQKIFFHTIKTFSSSLGQFYEAIYFLDDRACLEVFLPEA